MTRLLSPAEFGAYGVVISIIGVSSIFIDLGFRAAIIQSQDVTQTQLSTVFYLNILLSLLLVIGFSVGSYYIEQFYQIDSLSLYIMAASSVFFLSALNLVPGGLLQKNLELKAMSVINTVSAFLAGIIAVTLAILGFRVWALIAQQILIALFVLIGSSYAAGWKPSLAFQISSVRELWKFGSKLLASAFLNNTVTRVDVFIIGKLFPIGVLGYYNRAQSLDGLVRNFSSSTTTSIAFPTFSKIADKIEETRAFYKRTFHLISFLAFMLIGVLFLTCFDLVVILFGPQWENVGGFFRIMAVTGFVYPLSALMVNVLSARGNSKAFLKLEVIKTVILLPSYLSFFLGGVQFFLITLAVVFIINFVVNAVFVEKEIGIPAREQMSWTIKYALSAIISVVISFALTAWMQNVYIHFIASSIVFVVIYLLLNRLMQSTGMADLSSRLFNSYHDKRNANLSASA